MARPVLGLHFEVTHGLAPFADRTGAKIRRGATRGAKRFEARAKLEYRQDVRWTGLGDRLANTWRTRVYPQRGESWHPTVHVWSNAPVLAKAHADGGVIVPKADKFLAIPIENIGRKSGRRVTKIHGELLKLGIQVASSTGSIYMVPRRDRPLQNWKTFLHNHGEGIASVDLFWSDDWVSVAVCMSCSRPQTPAAPLVCSNPQPDGRMVGAPDHRSASAGCGIEVSRSGQ